MTDADSNVILGGSEAIDREAVYAGRNSPVAFDDIDLVSWAWGDLWAMRSGYSGAGRTDA